MHNAQEINDFRNPNLRYFVPDLSPQDRDSLSKMKPKWIFVAESPHISEIESEEMNQRRPLCGMAGRQWWGLLTELLEGKASSDVSLQQLVKFCLKYKIAVMNSVQFPLDPKVEAKFPEASPVKNLGFSKVSGPYSYKKLKNTKYVNTAIELLRARLEHPSVVHAPIYCLGNDAQWFVSRALENSQSSKQARLVDKIPHPSAWWRKGGYFGKVAREKLEVLLGGSENLT